MARRVYARTPRARAIVLDDVLVLARRWWPSRQPSSTEVLMRRIGLALALVMNRHTFVCGLVGILTAPRAAGAPGLIGTEVRCRERLGGLLGYYYRAA